MSFSINKEELKQLRKDKCQEYIDDKIKEIVEYVVYAATFTKYTKCKYRHIQKCSHTDTILIVNQLRIHFPDSIIIYKDGSDYQDREIIIDWT
jgi:hypothetical protein